MKNKITSASPINWTCTSCSFNKLPFNRNSDILIGVFYQPNFESLLVQAWFDRFDRILNRVLTNWNGITIITGDMNIKF